jgi:hypothetical protein
MTTTRRILSVGAALALVLTACGGSDSDDGVEETVVTTEPDTEPPDDFTPVEDAEVTTDTTADSGPVDSATADSGPLDSASDDSGATAGTSETTVLPTTAGTSDGGSAAATSADATLVEWEIDAPTEYEAGEVTFTATNDGNFPHEFLVIRGDGYDSLPLADGGAVIEDELEPGALLGRTDRIGGGSSAELTVDLEAGNYVLLCNLGSGSNSHAGQGQTLDITVS